ncbi:MAG: hypothetical protein RR281_01940, partial [Pseudoflavonifractor sp.]
MDKKTSSFSFSIVYNFSEKNARKGAPRNLERLKKYGDRFSLTRGRIATPFCGMVRNDEEKT